MATLVAPDGTSFELAEGETLVGRGERELGDPPKVNLGPLHGGLTVSRQHARLRQQSEQWYVEAERQSTNDTLVDGLSLPRGMSIPIQDGARLQLGEVLMVFRGPAASAELDADTLDADGAAPPATNGRLVSVVPPGVRESANWVGRMPARARIFDAVGGALKRVNPFEGLMVDDTTWSDDQQYHRDAARIHVLADHGWGIVEGLEVTIDQDAARGLIVHSGVAIDPYGRVVLVRQDIRLDHAYGVGQRCFVTLAYAEQPVQPQSAWDGAEHATRLVESVVASIEAQPPVAPALELARFVVSNDQRDAVDPTNPQAGDIDLRYRERQWNRPRPELGIAQLAMPDDHASAQHRLGLRFLAREISQMTAYRPRWAGSVGPGEALPAAALVYMTGDAGFTLDGNRLHELRAFLNSGGVLFADACAAGHPGDFVVSVEEVAVQLGVTLRPVQRWHPLLLSRHVLVAPDSPSLLEGEGIVLSAADYGCAWQGGPESEPVSREMIREALELGTNAAVYGQQRRRPLDVLDFEA